MQDARKIYEAFLIDDAMTELLRVLAEYSQPVTTKVGIEIGAVSLTDIYIAIETAVEKAHDNAAD